MRTFERYICSLDRCILAGTILFCSGCRLPWQSSIEYPCHQTFEFGNQGCAGLVVLVEKSADPLPKSYYFMVNASSTRGPHQAGYGNVDFYDTIPRVVELRLTRWNWGPGDTESVWITASIVDRTRRHKSSGQYLTAATVTTLHVVKFAPIGDSPWIDTVQLSLRHS